LEIKSVEGKVGVDCCIQIPPSPTSTAVLQNVKHLEVQTPWFEKNYIRTHKVEKHHNRHDPNLLRYARDITFFCFSSLSSLFLSLVEELHLM